VELYEHIRREYEHGAGTIRAVARRLGVHRREVRQALASAVPPERKKPEGSDRSWPRRCRSSTRFWKRIVEPRASSGTRRIAFGRGCDRRSRRLLSASPRCASMCASASRRWGCWDTRFSSRSRTSLADEAQVDWYEIFAEIDGQQRKIYVFCMRSMASGAALSSGLSARHAAGIS